MALTAHLFYGGLAILNVIVAFRRPQPNDPLKEISWNQGLSLAAAVYAGLLALLTNVESFLNYADKKASSRESRELFLDAYRNFKMLWLVRVFPSDIHPKDASTPPNYTGN